jgi:hypothetical protein
VTGICETIARGLVTPGSDTGRFFTGQDDVTGAVAACLTGDFAPRAWFSASHGPEHAASRLAAFLDAAAEHPLPAADDGAAAGQALP